ncbi:uncharacterized protein PGTG_05224 [Puccinia graminis f. sp. tritici CRL 75-36-700-3]|uniref:Uncharacterized protein n=1 Tax=Puccinia graminis f. sp. tritici (strain CRL 75-36-700-3 / race SCCL) TaxID=418459 RepID=E3K789_PUCGT|nr:uncharacterized protein PGTG_05224 [Puccinia graminis f. sp. tritici CRL 75-36-700-3]EFP79999.2 hypothetical protein PGTG_05224 [Puccinia graminis f. sp. tritici CRL 75-36-700-3]
MSLFKGKDSVPEYERLVDESHELAEPSNEKASHQIRLLTSITTHTSSCGPLFALLVSSSFPGFLRFSKNKNKKTASSSQSEPPEERDARSTAIVEDPIDSEEAITSHEKALAEKIENITNYVDKLYKKKYAFSWLQGTNLDEDLFKAFDARYIYGEPTLRALKKHFEAEMRYEQVPNKLSPKMESLIKNALQELSKLTKKDDQTGIKIAYYARVFAYMSGYHRNSRTPFNCLIMSHIKKNIQTSVKCLEKKYRPIFNQLNRIFER